MGPHRCRLEDLFSQRISLLFQYDTGFWIIPLSKDFLFYSRSAQAAPMNSTRLTHGGFGVTRRHAGICHIGGHCRPWRVDLRVVPMGGLSDGSALRAPVSSAKLPGLVPWAGRRAWVGKGQLGSAPLGSLHILRCLTEGLFGYSHSPTFIFPKMPGRTFFPNLAKVITFAAFPLVLTPFVRNRDQGIFSVRNTSDPHPVNLDHLDNLLRLWDIFIGQRIPMAL